MRYFLDRRRLRQDISSHVMSLGFAGSPKPTLIVLEKDLNLQTDTTRPVSSAPEWNVRSGFPGVNEELSAKRIGVPSAELTL